MTFDPETETTQVGVPALQAAEPLTKVVPAGALSVTTKGLVEVDWVPVFVATKV